MVVLTNNEIIILPLRQLDIQTYINNLHPAVNYRHLINYTFYTKYLGVVLGEFLYYEANLFAPNYEIQTLTSSDAIRGMKAHAMRLSQRFSALNSLSTTTLYRRTLPSVCGESAYHGVED